MEPNCAICNGPAYRQCPCEHQSLILAVEQSEQRVLHPMWDEIRYWVTTQAKAEIHRDFQARSSYRRAKHSAFLSQNTGRFTNELLDRVNRDLQRGIDDDWRAAVQRYPEVLDYFYSMVAWTVRGDCMSPGAGAGAGGPMLSPRSDVPSSHGEGYFSGRGMGGIHIPCDHGHGPLPYAAPIGGSGGIDGKCAPTRPFYGRNNSYGSVYSASSSGYASGSGSISPSSSSSPGRDSRQNHPPVHFHSYAYGRPPAQVYRP